MCTGILILCRVLVVGALVCVSAWLVVSQVGFFDDDEVCCAIFDICQCLDEVKVRSTEQLDQFQ